jgi:hypothetical protein
MVPPADNPAHLSVTRALIVQFRADTVRDDCGSL